MCDMFLSTLNSIRNYSNVSVLLDWILLRLSERNEAFFFLKPPRSNIVLHFLPRQATLVPSILNQEKQYYKKQR